MNREILYRTFYYRICGLHRRIDYYIHEELAGRMTKDDAVIMIQTEAENMIQAAIDFKNHEEKVETK